jgi:hypothetical protein
MKSDSIIAVFCFPINSLFCEPWNKSLFCIMSSKYYSWYILVICMFSKSLILVNKLVSGWNTPLIPMCGSILSNLQHSGLMNCWCIITFTKCELIFANWLKNRSVSLKVRLSTEWILWLLCGSIIISINLELFRSERKGISKTELQGSLTASSIEFDRFLNKLGTYYAWS